ncbi:MAG TPA: ElyC/SanA/YdcF family protein, partial [Desulfobaccales bacterium]|nr:ElyC/SanA/YdcF family protein [Desulfobaccales bacterium]
GRVFDPVPESKLMAQIAVDLGVRPQDIKLESGSHDTAQEAQNIAQMIGKEKIILVTSAAHMPRALALFKKRGLEPIPAPTNYLARIGRRTPLLGEFFPRSDSLEEAQSAFHEYMGLAWAWLRGKI